VDYWLSKAIQPVLSVLNEYGLSLLKIRPLTPNFGSKFCYVGILVSES